MPAINKQQFLSRPFSIWVNGPEKSGKTRLAAGFPRVFAVTFDPTGLDVLREPENQHLLDNIVYECPMNGRPLREVFQFSEQPGEQGIYPAIALAKVMAAKGTVRTFLLDGFTYLAQLKWTQICESKGVVWTEKQEMDRKEADQRSWYDALGSYLDHLMLQNVFPLTSPPYNLNVVVTCHVQRESENQIKGQQVTRTPQQQEQAAAGKRQVNLESDLSPQVLGSFRQRIGGMPSAHIYLEHKLVTASEDDVKKGRAKKEGEEFVDYYAYCKMTRSHSLDTVIKAGNRYGLGTLRLTGGSFYKTLALKVQQAQEIAAKPTENTTTNTNTTAKGA